MVSTKENMPEMIAKWSADLGIPLEPWQRDMIARIYGNRARGMASAYTLSRNGQMLEQIKRDLAEAQVNEFREAFVEQSMRHGQRVRHAWRSGFGWGVPIGAAVGALVQFFLVVWLGHV